ncbi:CocE/NonD family hydrolase [Paraburkholderia sp. BR14320]|uniref:CocE/NonD family hydrolase n=1 Tax=unclassified Paraburkholderia TaxID=2615204 RepID=UPI0034CFD55E
MLPTGAGKSFLSTSSWFSLEGVSYNGTLPMMIAATDVPNLDATVPVQGISNGYDHFLTTASMRY